MVLEYGELVDRVRLTITEVTPEQLAGAVDPPPAVIDLREADEVARGAIPGARFIPRGVLEGSISLHYPDPNTEMVLYCASGLRSVLAARALGEMGYHRVASLAGGLDRWQAEGRPLEVPKLLGVDQRIRYSRQLSLAEVGETGQQRLLASKVLVVGAGGLGSPVLLYLAAAGVGTLGIVDADVVELSNLQRQILHGMDGLGSPKVESAVTGLQRLNPDVKVESYPVRLSAANALEIMGPYDVVVDGTDNFPTRYLLNDAALHLHKPVVHGSLLRFEAQATVLIPYRGPCYRCLFPEPPPRDMAPSCAEAGVLGVIPGLTGCIQAVEVIKLLLRVGDSLVGRLLVYNALAQEFHSLSVRRDPACPACADPTRPPRLVDYDDACRSSGSGMSVG